MLFAALWRLQGAARVENGEEKSTWLKDGNNSLRAALLERGSGRDWWHRMAPGWQGWHIPPGRWNCEGNSHLSCTAQSPARCGDTARRMRVAAQGCHWQGVSSATDTQMSSGELLRRKMQILGMREGAVMGHSHCQGFVYSIRPPGAEPSGCSGCHTAPCPLRGPPAFQGSGAAAGGGCTRSVPAAPPAAEAMKNPPEEPN